LKFFVDNNLPAPLARALHELTSHEGDHHEVAHLKDKFTATTPDLEWIEALAEESGWAVITHDKLNKGLEREALRRAGLIVFFLDKSWSNHNYWDKAQRLVQWWPAIIDQAERISGGAAFTVKWNYRNGKFEQTKI
jgi:hypothetical protein